MKILMLAPEPFFEPRGTPISVYQRLMGLSSLGHTVDLITYHVGADVEIKNVRIIRTLNIPFIKKVKIGPSWIKPFLDLLLFVYAFIWLFKEDYDVIHSHEEASFFALFLARLFRTRHLYDMHSSLPKQLENFRFGNWRWLVKIFEFFENWVLKTCDAVITIDHELAAQVKQIKPNIRQKIIENIPIYLDSQVISTEDLLSSCGSVKFEDRLPIVYTGTFEPYQGLDMLLNSMSIVKKKFPGAFLLMVGGQPKQIEELQDLVRNNCLEEDVCFVGTVPPQLAMSYHNIAEILVSPRTQGTSVPLKIYSYLNSGKPIVATRLPAHTQVLDDSMAVLVDPSSEALADGIVCLLNNQELGSRLGEKAKQVSSESYSMESYLRKVAQIYSCLKSVPTSTTSEPKLRSLES
jgi:glycosyltransferase involved in cell wall biosynthesis